MKKLFVFLAVALMVLLPLFVGQASPAKAYGCYDVALDALNRSVSPAQLRADAKFTNDWFSAQGIPVAWGTTENTAYWQNIQIWNPANPRIGFPGGELVKVVVPTTYASNGGQVCNQYAANVIQYGGDKGRWMSTGMAPAERLPSAGDARVPLKASENLGLWASQVK